jgi:ASC-1-like (ASCH) protein
MSKKNYLKVGDIIELKPVNLVLDKLALKCYNSFKVL